METFYTPRDLSKILKVSEVYVYKLTREGKIPFVRIGGKTLRFRESEIEAWIEKGREKRYYRDKDKEAPDQDPGHISEN